MSTTAIIYDLYIGADAERVFSALVEPESTHRYWGVTFETDWTPGAGMVWREGPAETTDPEQKVLAYDPPHRLSYTWHTFTPAWADHAGVDEELRAALAAEPRTTVTFTLRDMGPVTRLGLVHDGFAADGALVGMCAPAWPVLLSSLKTLLETGAPLPEPAG